VFLSYEESLEHEPTIQLLVLLTQKQYNKRNCDFEG